MSLRLKCQSCRTAFLIPDDQAGQLVTCPKCDAGQVALPGPKPEPIPVLLAPLNEAPDASVFVPSPTPRPPRRALRAMIAAALLLTATVAVILVEWPAIRGRLHPEPAGPIEVLARPSAPTRATPPPAGGPARIAPVAVEPARPTPLPAATRRLDPAESAASAYLQSLVGGDPEASRRLGTVESPPAISTFFNVRRDPDHATSIRGSFAPIAALHARIDEDFAFDPKIGRFTPRNALGPAADTLDALHAAKEKAEKDGLYRKIAGGTPDDLFDAAEQLGKVYTNLAETALAPRKLLPTYKHLIQDSKPPLPSSETALALDYADRRATWDALLGRPFLTLRSEGPFTLERAEVAASVADRLASYGDPPTPLRLELTRFQLDGIDTGWRVTAVRREPPPPNPEPRSSQPPSPASTPGEEHRPR